MRTLVTLELQQYISIENNTRIKNPTFCRNENNGVCLYQFIVRHRLLNEPRTMTLNNPQ